MKKVIWLSLISVSLFSCDLLMKKTPVEYFDIAALNCNMFMFFGSKQIKEKLEQKSLIYDEVNKKNKMADTYKENFEKGFLKRVEENYQKVKDLKVTDDTKAMIENSIGLYDYVLDKYRKDYVAIMQMKDENKPEAEIQKSMAEFDEKYLAAYQEKYNTFLDVSLAYAKRNNIPVNTF